MRTTLKRSIDLTAAAVGLIISSPVLAAVATLVRLRLGRPVLFRQARLGKDEHPFLLLKFRSMTDKRTPDGVLLPDADRLAPLGRFLRSFSLDEMPELWNVVRGQMSLVGPRPLPLSYKDRYTPTERRRHEVRPGITGWAQVNGRNAVDWDERLAMDVWYVDHQSTGLDLRILARTVSTVVKRGGINAQGEATMAELRPPLATESKT
jgi:lipopolysaccharide/colanic/teichoic acid biosynthesis glycosyltransferase